MDSTPNDQECFGHGVLCQLGSARRQAKEISVDPREVVRIKLPEVLASIGSSPISLSASTNGDLVLQRIHGVFISDRTRIVTDFPPSVSYLEDHPFKEWSATVRSRGSFRVRETSEFQTNFPSTCIYWSVAIKGDLALLPRPALPARPHRDRSSLDGRVRGSPRDAICVAFSQARPTKWWGLRLSSPVAITRRARALRVSRRHHRAVGRDLP